MTTPLPLPRRSRPLLVTALFASTLVATLVGGLASPAFAQANQDEATSEETSTASVRTANDEELKELLDDFKEAKKEKSARALADSFERLSAFNNPELLACARDGFKYKASSTDKKDAQEEAEALGMDEKDVIERLVELRVATVVEGASAICVAIGDEDSLKLLVKTLGDRKIAESIPKVTAIIDGLAKHRLASEKADEMVLEIIREIDQNDYGGDQFDYNDPGAQVTGYDFLGRYRAAFRYFGQRKTKDLDIVLLIARHLHAPAPGYVDDPNNPPADYWRARFETWQRYNRDVVWALKEITGQTWKPGYPDEGGEGEVARAWIMEHAEKLGLE